MNRNDQGGYRWTDIKGNLRNRFVRRRAQNLGIIARGNGKEEQVYRKPILNTYDSYYDNTQYDKLPDWDKAVAEKNDYIAVRCRKPRFQYPFAKTLSQRLTAKLIGLSVFPKFKIEDSPDDQDYINAVVRESELKSQLLEPIRKVLNSGSGFLRFKLDHGAIAFENWDAKYCYPVLLPNGELASIEHKYIYDDPEEKDAQGNPKKKWYRLELTQDSEILYDNPDYVQNEEPTFNVVAQYTHGLGFVQGQWLRTHKDSKDPDGYALVADIMSFIDEFNYSLSQSSQAVSYNQDPILTFTNMSEDEQDGLIRSVMKAWNLGKDGKAGFLESNLTGVERAGDLRDKVIHNIGDITRILMLDPEKIIGSAQSAKAMEVLHGPLKDLIDELRGVFEGQIKSLVLKMAIMILFAAKEGMDTPIVIPDGYVPQNLSFDVIWPPIFQQTMEDLQKKVAVASAATAANIISRESATRWIAKDFDIEDVEAEIAKIAAQPILNPFGGF